MQIKALSLLFLLFLTGCVGSIIGGHTNRFGDEFPDIRSVPQRADAEKSLGVHKGDEKQERATDFNELEKIRETINARNQALREGRFPNLLDKEKIKKSSLDDKGAL